jgi:hypothetical protein
VKEEREELVGIRLETREGEANRGKKKRKRQIDKDRAEGKDKWDSPRAYTQNQRTAGA